MFDPTREIDNLPRRTRNLVHLVLGLAFLALSAWIVVEMIQSI